MSELIVLVAAIPLLIEQFSQWRENQHYQLEHEVLQRRLYSRKSNQLAPVSFNLEDGVIPWLPGKVVHVPGYTEGIKFYLDVREDACLPRW